MSDLTEKELITVNILKNDVNYCIPTDPKGFLDYFQGIFDDVPEEYRASTKVYMTAGLLYDDPALNIIVSYERPETQDEEDERLLIENHRKKDKLRSDREQFEILKKRLGEQ